MADGGARIRRSRKKAPAPALPNVCVIMRAEAHPGLEERLQALLGDLAFSVRADEPGCLSYLPTRPIGASTHFAVHARFADWDAFERHAETTHLTRALPLLSPLLATPIALEIFLEL